MTVLGAQLTALGLDLLRRGYTVRFAATGQSMDPTIRHGELIHVAPIDGDRIEVGEIVLFATSRGLTAHRIVEIIEASASSERMFLSQGDLFSAWFEPVLGRHVLGRVVAVERGGRVVPLTGRLTRRLHALRAQVVRLRRRSLARLARLTLF